MALAADALWDSRDCVVLGCMGSGEGSEGAVVSHEHVIISTHVLCAGYIPVCLRVFIIFHCITENSHMAIKKSNC